MTSLLLQDTNLKKNTRHFHRIGISCVQKHIIYLFVVQIFLEI